ncbi:hypothetical protein EQG49_02270 [Periweissella cryptocerci]|uniref:Uncharacterized protein n=1 Tax=Periweissella cryptocerci TaxID=2506420 RepID=A0A4P6YRY0_9LACO|nr:hypothetical protein [Periweissella cryptocerci]QBO35372.1 hypothetical protein EQG49_02270 [Periweissella cryptocerci]
MENEQVQDNGVKYLQVIYANDIIGKNAEIANLQMQSEELMKQNSELQKRNIELELQIGELSPKE